VQKFGEVGAGINVMGIGIRAKGMVGMRIRVMALGEDGSN